MKVMSIALAIVVGVIVMTTAVASAHEFHKNPAESGFAGSGGTQTFHIKGVTITCSSATIDGGSAAAKEEVLPVEAKYSGCTSSSKAASVSAARFLFNANELATLGDQSTVTVLTKPETGECVFTLLESASLEKASYTDVGANLTVKPALKGISYELKETGTTACGTNGEKGSTAEYSGEFKTEKYEGLRCIFVGWGKGRYSDSVCTKESALFSFYENVATITSEEWG